MREQTDKSEAAKKAPALRRHGSHPRFATALRFWLKLGFISFGGPSGQIAIMHEELVERRKWISESRFLHALNYCMLLPGPEAQQLAVYIGWLLHKTLGGIVAGVCFVLPGAAVLWLCSFLYVVYGDMPWMTAIFYGLKPAVLAIVATAVIRIGRKALKNGVMWAIAGAAFVALFFLPFPVVIVSAAILGLAGGRLWPNRFLVIGGHGTGAEESETAIGGKVLDHTRPTLGRAIRVSAVCLAIWWLPVLLAGSLLGSSHTLFHEGIFFSKAAMVTFGGAYAVLPYVAQQAVETYSWLQPGEMMDGLGLAETTPGPLILVVQFVGFLGAWSNPGELSPLLAGTFGALLTTWVTFTPCFLWIFLGAPHIEQLRGNVSLGTALSAVTAAVVGVILNLAVWFGWHALLPDERGLDWMAAGISLAAFAGLLKWKWDIVPVVAGSGTIGLIYKLLVQPWMQSL